MRMLLIDTTAPKHFFWMNKLTGSSNTKIAQSFLYLDDRDVSYTLQRKVKQAKHEAHPVCNQAYDSLPSSSVLFVPSRVRLSCGRKTCTCPAVLATGGLLVSGKEMITNILIGARR